MKKNEITELVFVIDKSGSMGGFENDTIGGFNAMLKEQQKLEGEAILTTVFFDDMYEIIHDCLNISDVAPLSRKDYTVGGSTALLDALGNTIHRIRRKQKEADENSRADKVIFYIITDGQENSSTEYTFDMIKELIGHQKRKHGWEFVFFGANMDSIAEASRIGIAADRAHNFISDSKGIRTAYSAISESSSAFRSGKPFGFGNSSSYGKESSLSYSNTTGNTTDPLDSMYMSMVPSVRQSVVINLMKAARKIKHKIGKRS